MFKLYTFTLALLGVRALHAQTPCVDGMAGQFPCHLVDLYAHVLLEDIGNGDNTNDIWGWVSPNTGKEYALIGCSNGTAFLDITDPVSPVYVGFLPTHTIPSLWRGIKTYDHYCFVVSEAPGHGMQVFDLYEMENAVDIPVDFDETAHYDGFGNCHTIGINPDSPFAYCTGSNTFSGGLHIVNITDPLNPTLAGGFSADGYTHECTPVIYSGPDNDYLGKEIAVACNEDAVTVVDCTDKSDCYAVSVNGYEDDGYTHQGWFTKDMRYFLFNDELDEMELEVGTRTHIFDMLDLDNPNYMGFYQSSNTSIDHNLYVLDQFVFESNYRSGIRVLDASKIDDGLLSESAFFDLYPANDNAQFSGTWANYPYFPSGTLIATDMYTGIFILRPTMVLLSQNNWELCGVDEVEFMLDVNAELLSDVTIDIEGINGISISNPGSLASPFETNLTISGLTSLAPGVYSGNLVLNTTFGTQYEFPLDFTISAGAPEASSNMSPMIGATLLTSADISFTWSEQESVDYYTFQLATDISFADIVDEEVVLTNTYDYPSNLPEGEYFWRVKAHNTCGDGPYSSISDFSVIFVSINEKNEASFIVYPNPSSDVLNVVSENGVTHYTIFDILGQKVDQFSNQGKITFQYNVSKLESGVYFIESSEGERVSFVVR